jgi:hypothetical protein
MKIYISFSFDNSHENIGEKRSAVCLSLSMTFRIYRKIYETEKTCDLMSETKEDQNQYFPYVCNSSTSNKNQILTLSLVFILSFYFSLPLP